MAFLDGDIDVDLIRALGDRRCFHVHVFEEAQALQAYT